ncbi:MAG: TadE family type IV pilus minor pilin [Bowdeniella nasicola]|nr:TadE family type IV pilus minor pilin [Bowdeniella nasicola]
MISTAANARERGSATVETALVLPVLLLFVLIVLGAGRIGATSVAVTEAARVAARAVAAGYPPHTATQLAATTCACAADTTITTGKTTRVQVRATAGIHTWIPALHITASFVIPTETTLVGAADDPEE